MLHPNITTGIEQPYRFVRRKINTSYVVKFVTIAVRATQREIFSDVQSIMLAGNDVIANKLCV